MPTPVGADGGGVPAPLDLKGLETWAFFSLVERLAALFPDIAEIGGTGDPNLEHIRFKANPSLGYPARDVQSLDWQAQAERLDIYVNFLGLFGPSSPLPPFYTEEVIRDLDTGGGFAAFLDFFNHRLVSLLVRIHKHQRHFLRYRAGAGDPISRAVGALMGLLPTGGEEDRVALMPYAGLLSCYSLSASIIGTVIAHCTGLPARIEEFVPRTVLIPEHRQSRLGERAPELGVDFIVGSQVRDTLGKFRVVLGPLDQASFLRALPDQPLFTQVVELVELALRDPLAFDIRLELEPGAAPAFVLGEGRLGWNTWLDPSTDLDSDISPFADFAANRFAQAM
ncbi:type VI secretion system baseplate subunit TssG [Aquabacter cavernae]|uniref:type VI secretion system baseplate subunit TssG n=1 Tax=Aquabacter cavernae TaxID=2496029 RepID=UPI0013E03B46|nr:type VI secretion system baseplate subunit TssG [Aquabacter cavernae]